MPEFNDLKRKPGESAEEWQRRLEQAQHRPEQNEGYDEAARTPGKPDTREVPPDQRPRRGV